MVQDVAEHFIKAVVVEVTACVAKLLVFSVFVGFIVFRSAVAHDKCLPCFYGKYHSTSSMELCPSGRYTSIFMHMPYYKLCRFSAIHRVSVKLANNSNAKVP